MCKVLFIAIMETAQQLKLLPRSADINMNKLCKEEQC